MLDLSLLYFDFRMQRDFYRSARFHFGITCPMKQAIGDKTKDATFQTPPTDLLESTNIEEELYRLFEILGTKIDAFVRNG